MKKLLLFVILLAVFSGALVGGGIFAYHFFMRWSDVKVPLKEPVVFELKRGTSLTRLSHQLEKDQLTSQALFFSLWVKFNDDYSRFQAGKYRFENAVSPKDLISAFRAGSVYQPVVLEYVIPEGFTLKKIAARLEAKGLGIRDELLALAYDKQFVKELGIRSSSLEGYIYPATYRFIELPSARAAYEKMVNTFWNKLPKGYEKAVQEMGLTLTEAVTFASLIELESGLDDEKPLISEVIWRRLKKRMALAIDAAVIYGIEDYAGDIKWKHLKDENNPYNTRIHLGLPPTPIGSPSRSSLEAVLTPSDHGYLYYVLDVDQENRHHFSKTLKEHNKYVRKLVRKSRSQ